ncbi:MAG TPA: hypothetical protein VIZ43_30205, partial [Trebonia sp.]
APASSTGSRERPPWESGSQPAVPASGAQMSYPWESDARAQAEPTGTHPVPAAPWESGDWGRASDWQTVITAGEEDVPVTPAVAADAEPSSGSGTLPVVSPSAKPERHSHRGGKHGKPSRWRGSGNRSNGDGDS